MDTGALHPDARVKLLSDLALFMRGSQDSFTGRLLELIAHADPGNRSCLYRGFPEVVFTYEAWMACSETPTASELREQIDKMAKEGPRVGWGGFPR